MKASDDFERSADLRMLELSRESFGATRTTASSWRHQSHADPDEPPEDEVAARPAGALLAVHFVARPATGLIAGAKVTFAIAIENVGGLDATQLALRIAYDASLLPTPTGSRIDDDPIDERALEALFGSGLALGTLAAGARRTAILQVGIPAGVGPIVVEAVVLANQTPVLAATPIALERAGARSGVATRRLPPAIASQPAPSSVSEVIAPPERPFYELEPEESIAYEAVDAALSTAAPILAVPRSRAPLPAVPPDPAPSDAFSTEPMPEASLPPVAVPAPVAVPTPAAVPAPEPSPPPVAVSAPEPIPLPVAEPAPESSPPPVAVPAPEASDQPAVAPGPVASPPEPVKSLTDGRPTSEAQAIPRVVPPELLRAIERPERAPRVEATEPVSPSPDRPIVLIRIVDRARLDAVAGMFRNAGVGMLAHFLLANVLAAGQSPDESDPFGLAAFLDDQTTALNRLWVAKRLRKPMDVLERSASVATLVPLPRERIGPPGSLVARVGVPERAFINSAVKTGTTTFLRARQITMMLQATAIVTNGEVIAVPALVEYAQRAQPLMTKYALRAATKGPDEALSTVDPVLDGYAKDVLTFLESNVPARTTP